MVGGGQALPFENGSFDVVLSVFGVVFAPDAEIAVAELLRVVRPGGRVLVSAWLPQGPMHEFLEVIGQAMAAQGPARVGRRFAWGVPEATRELLERHGAAVEIELGELVFAGFVA